MERKSLDSARSFVNGGLFPNEIQGKMHYVIDHAEDVYASKPDVMHGNYHIEHLRHLANELPSYFDLTPDEQELLDLSLRFHDTGHKAVTAGLITVDEHQYVSALIAYSETGNEELARGILMHSLDALPEDAPDWVHLFRAFDRIDRLGWAGLIFTAYYLGFRHPTLNSDIYQYDLWGNEHYRHPLHETIKLDEADYEYKPIYSSWYPPKTEWTWTNYEEDISHFVKKHVFPFLVENDLAEAAIEDRNKWLMYADGEWEYNPELEEYFWPFEPIPLLVHALVSPLRFNTEKSIRDLSEYSYNKKLELQKLERWSNGGFIKPEVNDRYYNNVTILTLIHFEDINDPNKTEEISQIVENMGPGFGLTIKLRIRQEF